MSASERYPPDDPREWLNRARSNLAIARNSHPNAYLEDLCFEAQQAAEKAIKAVLLKRGIEFPYVHDLARLLSLLDETGETVPDTVWEAADLTPYAAATRYPGPARPVCAEQYGTALEVAEAVVRWPEDAVQSPSP